MWLLRLMLVAEWRILRLLQLLEEVWKLSVQEQQIGNRRSRHRPPLGLTEERQNSMQWPQVPYH
jgi:hypothetical protein